MVICPRCGSEVSLHEGRPVVTAKGVELWHSSCFAVRDARPVEVVTVVAPRPRLASGRVAAIGGVAVLSLVALTAWARAGKSHDAAAILVNPDIDVKEALVLPSHVTSHEEPAPRRDLGVRFPIPVENGVPLDELYPSLREWAHPVTDAPELMPDQASRHFGAERIGIERPECGAGHCGVDLDGPRGQPIVAVADGVAVRIEHSELGLDGRSGRYVRIQHEDGTLTAYMHLDDIAEGLEVGDRVEAGQLIGYLGATACYTAPAHLHFSLEIPNHPDMHGDITDTHYVDPAPFLVRATILPAGDRRHAEKPST
jgi:murein DD-endopeptidase MepM/ murein hydrolase activator NlpD